MRHSAGGEEYRGARWEFPSFFDRIKDDVAPNLRVELACDGYGAKHVGGVAVIHMLRAFYFRAAVERYGWVDGIFEVPA